MPDRFVGQVLVVHDAHSPRRYIGWIYDTSRPRGETKSGDLAQDYAFADFTEAFATRNRAEQELKNMLAELNGKGGAAWLSAAPHADNRWPSQESCFFGRQMNL